MPDERLDAFAQAPIKGFQPIGICFHVPGPKGPKIPEDRVLHVLRRYSLEDDRTIGLDGGPQSVAFTELQYTADGVGHRRLITIGDG